MSGIFAFLKNTISTALSGTAMDTLPSPHQPSISDVLDAKDTIFTKSGLPLEIIDVIIDFAEYWPCTTTIRTGEEISIRAGRPATENQFIVSVYSHCALHILLT